MNRLARRSLRNVLRTVAPGLLSSYIRKKWTLEPEVSLLPALCDHNRVSFDVGANWGQYAGALRPISAGVVACEPIPQLARFLRRSYPDGVRVEQLALSDKKGQAEFTVERDWGRSSLNGPEDRNGLRRLPVRLETLDSIAASPVGFIKIDVEGHEEEVMLGAMQVLGRDRPVLLIEIEERHRPGALGRILAKLSTQGYSAFFLHDGCVRDIARFQLTEHQNPANIPHEAHMTGSVDPRGCYINNFLFIHGSCLSEKERRLAGLGYSVVR
jgi:FkbM family methyltransferase